MEELLELLEKFKPGVDFKNNQHLIDEEELDSFDIVSLVSTLNQEYDIQITAADVVPENFNSAEAIYALVQRLEEE